jgi:hypothetical protein
MRVDIVYDDGLPIDLEHHRRHTRVEYTISAAVMHDERARPSAILCPLDEAAGFGPRRRTAAATPAKPAPEQARVPGDPNAGEARRDEGAVPCAM